MQSGAGYRTLSDISAPSPIARLGKASRGAMEGGRFRSCPAVDAGARVAGARKIRAVGSAVISAGGVAARVTVIALTALDGTAL